MFKLRAGAQLLGDIQIGFEPLDTRGNAAQGEKEFRVVGMKHKAGLPQFMLHIGKK